MADENKQKSKNSLVAQVSAFFAVGIVLTLCLSAFSLKKLSDSNVVLEKERLSSGIAYDVERTIKEYNSYEWVFAYLLEHADDPQLDIEYDRNYQTNSKVFTLQNRHPGLILNRVSSSVLDDFSEEDQRLFAEIVYNKWLTRLNDIKASYGVAYLYILACDDSYEKSIFFVTASDGTANRGTGPEDAYILGMTVDNFEERIDAFKKLKTGDHVVYTDDFLDRYRYMFKVGDMNILTGNTFELASIKKEVEYHTYRVVLLFVLLQILLSVFCLVLIYRFALKPLKIVSKSIYKYSEEKDGEKVRDHLDKIRSSNEIGALAREFSSMTSEVDSYVDEITNITAEKERIGAELNVATKIQADMLPSIFPAFPNIKSFDVYASMDPAKEVGGDFYDFFMIDDSHVALVIADVSGKGVPAALFMVIAKTLIKNRAMIGGSPSEILYDVNNQLCDGNTSDFFVTVWLAIVDVKTGKGVSVNAGHEHPAIKHADGKFELDKYPHSLAVAAMEGVRFKEREFVLKPGDRIMVYTDGVPESNNTAGELYGPDRMLDALNKDPDVAPEQLISNLKQDISVFIGDAIQFDDTTILVFDYKGETYAG
ncbi:MAG: PP2C family protein-serine/threonine phosphatase [Clostridiales bacterium]|nr:PP2C family protein-serine/threonine phosphatase [Clostridiales bacterium]